MVKTRIAPSPTGEDLHIGNLYTALINWVWAKKQGGAFIVRIEDTDRTRLIEGAEEKILQTLETFGLSPDEPVLRQSQRLDIYKKHVDELVEKKAAYYCFCTRERLDILRKKQQDEKKIPKYDKQCLALENSEIEKKLQESVSFVVRLNVPDNKDIEFEDVVRGVITINSDNVDDQVLLKSDGFPTYHLAVVVDDYLMKITHVIRAEEWISSTPKHVLLYMAFGWQLPVFAHVPILRNPDKSKLSKRKNPVWASWYVEQGFFPEAILNYLALMGWSHPQQKEIFSIDEYGKVFDLKNMSAVGPVFDISKLTWMNGEYIRAMEIKTLESKIKNFFGEKYSDEIINKTLPLVQERIKTLKEYDEYCKFFIEKPKHYEVDLSKYADILKIIAVTIENMSEWETQKIGEEMQKIAIENNIKNSEFFMILRIAIAGKKITPPLNESMEILGKSECLDRIKLAFS